MKKYSLYFLLFLISCSLVGCNTKKDEQKLQQTQIVTATLKSVPTQLFYSGTVSPIQVYNATSPTDGTIKEMFFRYGQIVNQGDKLLIISAAKLQDDYRTAVTNFIKAKEDYTNAQVNFQGTQELKKANIISEQEYLSEKDQYDETTLAYLNAKLALEQVISKIPGLTIQIEALSPDDAAALSKTLQTQYSDLPIVAKHSGVALAPQKQSSSSNNDSDSNKPLQVGTQVKEGQTLLTLGDLTGIATTLSVSELAVNQIKPGEDVTVTLEAIPSITLKGKVKSVGAQAQASDGGQSSVATFPVTVVVPTITAKQQKLIRVGMSTKIQITIQNPPAIMLPIAAVYQKNGVSMINVLKNGQQRAIPVQTGQTNLTDVAITQGLKAGDQVIVPVTP